MKAGPALARYFNSEGDPEGYAKKTTGEFASELRALHKDDKAELGQLACAEMNTDFTPAA